MTLVEDSVRPSYHIQEEGEEAGRLAGAARQGGDRGSAVVGTGKRKDRKERRRRMLGQDVWQGEAGY